MQMVHEFEERILSLISCNHPRGSKYRIVPCISVSHINFTFTWKTEVNVFFQGECTC